MDLNELLSHPLFDERDLGTILEPLGYEVHIETVESPDPDDRPASFAAFEGDPAEYIDQLEFLPPIGFTELCRFDNEDCEIVMVAIKPTTPFALSLMPDERVGKMHRCYWTQHPLDPISGDSVRDLERLMKARETRGLMKHSDRLTLRLIAMVDHLVQERGHTA